MRTYGHLQTRFISMKTLWSHVHTIWMTEVSEQFFDFLRNYFDSSLIWKTNNFEFWVNFKIKSAFCLVASTSYICFCLSVSLSHSEPTTFSTYYKFARGFRFSISSSRHFLNTEKPVLPMVGKCSSRWMYFWFWTARFSRKWHFSESV